MFTAALVLFVLQSPPPEPQLIPALIERLADVDADVRQYAALALANLGEPAIEPLKNALLDKNPITRASAAYALGQIGPSAQTSIGRLIKVLQDPDRFARRQAAYALGKIPVAEFVGPQPSPGPEFPKDKP